MKKTALWSNSDFLKFWGAQACSLIGSQTTMVALPLVAITQMNASAWKVGVLASANYLPFLLFGLPAGVWVDRLPRKKILLHCDWVRGVLLAVIPLAFYFRVLSFELLFAVAFLNGVFSVLFDAAHFSFLPQIVNKEDLVEGNTKLYSSYSVAQLTGPAMAGFLIQWLNAPSAILFDAFTFFASFALVCTIRKKETQASSPTRGQKKSLTNEVREGLHFVLGNRYLKPIVITMGIVNTFSLFGMVQAILPSFATSSLKLSAAQYGSALALGNCGPLLGSFLNARIVNRLGFGVTLVAGGLIAAIGLLLIPLLSTSLSLFSLVLPLGICGFGIALFNVNQLSLRQAVTPHHLLGRMNATVRFIVWGSIPLGTCLGGLLADKIGLREAFWIAGIGSLLGNLPLLFSKVSALKSKDMLRLDSETR